MDTFDACAGLNSISPNSCPLATSEGDLIGNRVLADVISQDEVILG